jgi:hypothetical protein
MLFNLSGLHSNVLILNWKYYKWKMHLIHLTYWRHHSLATQGTVEYWLFTESFGSLAAIQHHKRISYRISKNIKIQDSVFNECISFLHYYKVKNPESIHQKSWAFCTRHGGILHLFGQCVINMSYFSESKFCEDLVWLFLPMFPVKDWSKPI